MSHRKYYYLTRAMSRVTRDWKPLPGVVILFKKKMRWYEYGHLAGGVNGSPEKFVKYDVPQLMRGGPGIYRGKDYDWEQIKEEDIEKLLFLHTL